MSVHTSHIARIVSSRIPPRYRELFACIALLLFIAAFGVLLNGRTLDASQVKFVYKDF
jgi:hypothetical protein